MPRMSGFICVVDFSKCSHLRVQYSSILLCYIQPHDCVALNTFCQIDAVLWSAHLAALLLLRQETDGCSVLTLWACG